MSKLRANNLLVVYRNNNLQYMKIKYGQMYSFCDADFGLIVPTPKDLLFDQILYDGCTSEDKKFFDSNYLRGTQIND